MTEKRPGHHLSALLSARRGRWHCWSHTTATSRAQHPPPQHPGDAAPTCVFCVGICKTSARLLWSKFSSRASSAPCTPLSTRLFAYSRSPMDWIQWMTWSLVHTNTSAKEQGHVPGQLRPCSGSCWDLAMSWTLAPQPQADPRTILLGPAATPRTQVPATARFNLPN